MMRPDRIVQQQLRTRFIITMKSGQTWSALLISADRNTLHLAEASAITPGGDATPADGQIFLPRADVAYMQRA
jgi:hypothetical protein